MPDPDQSTSRGRRSPSEENESSGRLALVFASQNIPEGMLVKGLLEAEGIRVFVKGESEGPYRVGPVYLWVPEELEVQARMLVEDAQAGRLSNEDE